MVISALNSKISGIRKKVFTSTNRLFLAYFSIVFLSVSPAANASEEASTTECKNHRELIQLTLTELNSVEACDDLGRLYIMGAVGIFAGLKDESFPEEYTYYLLSRTFLSSEKFVQINGGERSAYIQLLVSILSLLDESKIFNEGSQSASSQRKKYYIAYLLTKYWEQNPLSRLDESTITDALNSVLNLQPLTGNQINCFFESDIPTLPVEEIFSSASYIGCLDG